MAHPNFEIKKGKDEKFYFNLTAKNGQVILASQGYNSKASCMNGIESVKTNAKIDTRFERLDSKSGYSYFILKAGNGETIGKSEVYKSKQSLEKGIASVITNAGIANVIEL